MRAPEDDRLPPLREDLRILRGAPLPSGAPGWVIFDPVRHRYFQIGRGILDILGAWGEGTVTGLAARLRAGSGRSPAEGEIEGVRTFLAAHELVAGPGGSALAGKVERARHHWLAALVHNYLFFRIPLVRPQAFLDRTRWVADLVFSPAMLIAAALAGLLGGFLVIRQWDAFLATGLDLLSLEGALVFAACLPLVKTLHELGHAWMATRYGVRVPTMGIAFMVMAPFLYSDVSDAWRLTSRRQRLAIDSAGLLVELMLGAFALLVWVFLPHGPLRSAVFVLATTSLAMGLLLNLNPFMRFDGYHILADAVGFPNLQTRAMAVGRWLLREALFGVGAPCPEPVSRRAALAMALYAFATWIYRFVLFLGIALLVYHMAFKLLGIILFAIEIVWFIALPVLREIGQWWRGRAIVARRGRSWVTLGVVGTGLALVLIPLPTNVAVPVIAAASRDAAVFASSPARVSQILVEDGVPVTAGQVLFVLESPDLAASLAQDRIRLALLETRLVRASVDTQDRSEWRVLEQEALAVRRRIEGLERQQADLVIRAPHVGRIRDLDPALVTGLWVNQKAPLAHVVADGAPELRGYVAQDDVHRLSPGSTGRFLPDDVLRAPVAARLVSISETAVETLDIPALASTADGPVAAVASPSGRAPHPLVAQFAVVMTVDPDYRISQMERGHVRLEGAPESYAARLLRRVLGVLIRESGA